MANQANPAATSRPPERPPGRRAAWARPAAIRPQPAASCNADARYASPAIERSGCSRARTTDATPAHTPAAATASHSSPRTELMRAMLSDRDRSIEGRPGAGRAVHAQRPAQRRDAIGETAQAGAGHQVGAAATVVGDRRVDGVAFVPHPDLHV